MSPVAQQHQGIKSRTETTRRTSVGIHRYADRAYVSKSKESKKSLVKVHDTDSKHM
jgi:hypothetical protein